MKKISKEKLIELSKKRDELSNINIKDIYADELDIWDVIVHKEIWHIYNENVPCAYDIIDNNIIYEVVEDKMVYKIKYKE